MAFWQKLRGWVGGDKETSAPSPRDLYRAEVEARLKAMPVVASVAPRAGEYGLDVVLVDGGCQTLFLENTFQETRELSLNERQERIRRLISTVGRNEPELVWAAAQERLVPLIRSCSLFLGIDEGQTRLPIRRPFAPLLIETVALDSDDSFMYVSPDAASKWGVTTADVFEAALATAARCFGDEDVGRYDAEADFALWHVARDDGYETSRLALPGWLASFEGRVSGSPVAIIPQRSLLVVGGDGDERCLKRLIEIAEREYSASPRNISPALYTVDDQGTVVPLVLPPEHPLANEVALGHVRLAVAEYEAGKELLQKELGDDVFVASYVGIQRQDGRVTSYTVWTEDVPSMLPRAAEIAFVRQTDQDARDVFRVAWEAVEREGLLEPLPDSEPPRWRTKEWPNRKLLKRLRAAAVG